MTAKRNKRENSESGDASYPAHARGLATYLAPGLTTAGSSTGARQGYNYEDTRKFDFNFFLFWPPNLFAFTSYFLQTTGSYTFLSRVGRSPTYLRLVEAWSNAWIHNLKKLQNKAPQLTLYYDTFRSLVPEDNLLHGPTGRGTITRSQNTPLLSDLIFPDTYSPQESRARYDRPGVKEKVKKAVNQLAPSDSLCRKEWKKLKLSDREEEHIKSTEDFEGSGSSRRGIYQHLRFECQFLTAWNELTNDCGRARFSRARDVWNRERDEYESVKWALALMHATADRVCEGWGIRSTLLDGSDNDAGRSEWWYLILSKNLLEHSGNLSLISNDRGRVLPKRHTPNVGLSLRSSSLCLAFHRSHIQINWNMSDPILSGSVEDPASANREPSDSSRSCTTRARHEDLSMLLLPWPLRVRGKDFLEDEVLMADGTKPKAAEDKFNASVGFFRYHPKDGGADKEVGEILRRDSFWEQIEAELASPVDIVLLPEAAISNESDSGTSSLDTFERVLFARKVKAYIAGVRVCRRSIRSRGPKLDENWAYFGIRRDSTESRDPGDGNRYERFTHQKHHRWCLDGEQIKRYQLGGHLYPGIPFWEHINVSSERYATFVNLGDALTIAPLICEDLARQDSLSELIQAVGPSLVTSILMDGPQLRERWSAKYAGVFGADPGCAVITLTSKGMIARSTETNVRLGPIALWTERGGQAKEISLASDSCAVLLSLAVLNERQSAIDGRTAGIGTYSLQLAGIHQIASPRPSR